MTDELLGYLLKLDEPAERQRVEAWLRDHPKAAWQLETLQRLVEPLEADREPPVPPPDLVARTIGRVAEHICSQQISPPEVVTPSTVERLAAMSPRERRRLLAALDRPTAVSSRWRPADFIVTAAILLIGVGLVLAALPYLRYRQNMMACQNHLKELALALDTYADTHEGRFPQVLEGSPNLALVTLTETGALSSSAYLECPAAGPNELAGYAYTLGYRDESNQLNGLRRDLPLLGNDLLPIAADRPALGRTSPNPSHRYGQNVLYVGGNVRFCTTSNVGVAGDDIYLNQARQVRAGLRLWDSVLGVSGDQP